jgi:hypothetical protein
MSEEGVSVVVVVEEGVSVVVSEEGVSVVVVVVSEEGVRVNYFFCCRLEGLPPATTSHLLRGFIIKIAFTPLSTKHAKRDQKGPKKDPKRCKTGTF